MGSQWSEQDDEDTIDLREYWQILVRRRWVVLTILVLALVGGLLVTYLTTPIFRATLLLQIEPEPPKVLKYENIVQAYNEKNFYQTQYQLLRSYTLVRRVIEQLDLENPRNFPDSSEGSFWDSIAKPSINALTGDAEPPAGKSPVIEKTIQRHLTVEPMEGGRLVKIHYEGPDPKQAAGIANAVAENYIDTTLERRFGASSYAKAFLDERIRHVRANLEDGERKLLAYVREREIVSLENQMDTLTQRLKDVSGQLFEVETKRMEAQTEYDIMRAGSESAHKAIVDNPIIQSLEARRQELQREYDKNLEILKPGYPAMKQLREQIGGIEGKLSGELQTILESARKNAMIYAARESELRTRIDQIKEQMLSLQDQSTDYQTLKRDIETNRQLYEVLLQRVKEVDLIAGIGTTNIAVVDPAEIPGHPYKPNLSKNLTLAFVLGLFGGGLIAFLFEQLDDTLKTGEELERHLGVPLLGVTPNIDHKEMIGEEEIALLIHRAPNSILAEAYRSIRTGLFFSTPDGAPKILHFTSSGAVEGKTTSAIGVATTFVQTGKLVLLIDADLRNPSLHKLFGLPHAQGGLSNYLTGDSEPYEITHPTEIEQLFVIPSGPLPVNPVELLSNAKMRDLLNIALERFDYIIIDSPPVVGLADSLVLSSLAHATVFITAANTVRRSIADASIKRLRSANAMLVGSVLTRMNRQGRYDYYYDYSYNYSYGTKTTQALDGPSA